MIVYRIVTIVLVLIIIALVIALAICCKKGQCDRFESGIKSSDQAKAPAFNAKKDCWIPWRDRVPYSPECRVDCSQKDQADNPCCKEDTCKAQSGACFQRPPKSESWIEDVESL